MAECNQYRSLTRVGVIDRGDLVSLRSNVTQGQKNKAAAVLLGKSETFEA